MKKDEYYERGSIFIWNRQLFILTSIPQLTEKQSIKKKQTGEEQWLFCLISLIDGNRLNNPVIKNVGIFDNGPLEDSSLFIKKNSPLFKAYNGEIKFIENSTEIMEHITKSVLLLHQI